MFRHARGVLILLLCFLAIGVNARTVTAATPGISNMASEEPHVAQALAEAKQNQLSDAKTAFDHFQKDWLRIEMSVKAESGVAYSDIESNMGQVEYAFIQHKQQDIIQSLQGLMAVNQQFIDGKYAKEQFKQENITLSNFIMMLQQAKSQVQHHDRQAALSSVDHVRTSWLSVEGTVVAQSNQAYNDAERDMVTVHAMIAEAPPNYSGAEQLLQQMVTYLSPLASKSGYTIWDAALIPIREGLEALLVVAALLTVVKKSEPSRGERWIWGGVIGGVAVSIGIAAVVKFVFSSGVFGNNNFLISGWTGVVAAVMLLYMSYWLHSKTNISDWNKMIRTKSQSALNTGKLISLGLLAFLAVLREGTETVLFLIGMVNQISLQHLLLGLLLGFGVLAIIAYLMLFVGMKLPMRPFFIVSSLIVFYLCVKFTGMGIHSLQLAGLLPATPTLYVPNIDFLALYPSWESAAPQLVLVLFAIIVVIWKNRSAKKQRHSVNNSA